MGLEDRCMDEERARPLREMSSEKTDGDKEEDTDKQKEQEQEEKLGPALEWRPQGQRVSKAWASIP
eukprot:3851552-Alexandrium_andersonii.AAC.1